MVATRSSSSITTNKDTTDGKKGQSGKKERIMVASKAEVSGEKKLFTKSVRTPCTMAMFKKFYESATPVMTEEAENNTLKLVGPTHSTEKRMLTEAVGGFNHTLHKRREDLAFSKTVIAELNEKMINALKNGEDITEINRQLVQQASIAAEHEKYIEKIEQNETKHAVKYCKQRVSYVIQRYIEEGDHKCANLGLVDAKQRLEALAPRLQVDQSPDVFDSSKYSVTKEGKVVTAKKIGWSTVRLTPAVKSGVLKFKVKVLRKNDLIAIGCVPTTAENLKTESLCNVGHAYWSFGRKHALGGVAEHYGARYGTGDVIEVTIDMDARTLSFATNGVSHGVAFDNLPEEGVYPAISMYGIRRSSSVEIL